MLITLSLFLFGESVTQPQVDEAEARVAARTMLIAAEAAARATIAEEAAGDFALTLGRGATAALFREKAAQRQLIDHFVERLKACVAGKDAFQLLHAFRDVKNLPALWSTAKPLGQWDGVKVSEQGSVTEIDLRRKQLQGHVDLTQLPPMLKRLRLNSNQLTGHVDLTKLPATLNLLCLDLNKLMGPADLTKLPRSLRRLDLDKNQVTLWTGGTVDLTQLPPSLKELNVVASATSWHAPHAFS